MNANQHTPQALDRLSRGERSVLTFRQLTEHGVPAAVVAERCRPGGPWQQVLPQVCVLHAGPPSSRERVQAALLYAGREPEGRGRAGGGRAAGGREAMVTGLAALALHRFPCVPPLAGLPKVDVLVPRHRRLPDVGDVTLHRTRELPEPQNVDGLPCAPVARALADAVAGLDGVDTVRVLFAEALRGGHCEASAVVAELAGAGLLEQPYVRGALDVLRAEGRAAAEQRLYALVRRHRLPEPVWNVALALPGGPPLGAVDAYWPEHAVAVVIDARTGDEARRSRSVRRRERLEALGITLLLLTPAELRDAAEQQAAAVGTALMDAAERAPAAYLVVVPR
jgi:hypothetical protein